MTMMEKHNRAPSDGKRPLAQPGDEMFSRNLSILAAKGREVEVSTSNGERFVGFASGLDEEYLQLFLTEDQTQVLVNRDYIVRLEETGETLSSLDQEGLPGIQRLRDRVRAFRSVAGNHFDNTDRR